MSLDDRGIPTLTDRVEDSRPQPDYDAILAEASELAQRGRKTAEQYNKNGTDPAPHDDEF